MRCGLKFPELQVISTDPDPLDPPSDTLGRELMLWYKVPAVSHLASARGLLPHIHDLSPSSSPA